MSMNVTYDPVSKKMVVVQNGTNGSGGRSTRTATRTYSPIEGEMLAAICEFAKADGFDLGEAVNSPLRGKAVNTYVHAAVREFIVARRAAEAVATVPAEPTVNTEAVTPPAEPTVIEEAPAKSKSKK